MFFPFPFLLFNLQLGVIILDTCSSDSYALNQSLEFVRASINTVEASAFQCSDGSIPRPKYGMKTISGVVGGSYSEVSLQVANLLRLFKIPQVSNVACVCPVCVLAVTIPLALCVCPLVLSPFLSDSVHPRT